jgi:deoxycytidine triphosphate deaminase
MQVSLEEFQRELTTLLDHDLPNAEARFRQLEAYDPYPGIPPSLLHSGHLASYVAMTGMIDPFDINALQKPATYLVSLEGLVRYRDRRGQLQRFYLSSNSVLRSAELSVRDVLVLEQNSLCYVTLQPFFRMPAYIAGRFNLLIRDVYRGLLVGTGPLVDPGFCGRLSIPLHNFTSSEYLLRAGEGFVYFEFTKLGWDNGDQPRPCVSWWKQPVSVQPPFPGSKNERRTIDDYLIQATGGLPAENAIGAELRQLNETTATIAQRARLFTIAGYVGIAGLVIITLAALLTGWQVYLGAQQVVQGAQTDVAKANSEITAAVQKARKVEEFRVFESQLDRINKDIHDFERGLSQAGAPSER